MYMEANSIDVMCVQETRKLNSDKFNAQSGHFFFLSGSSGVTREWAGVGLIVAKHLENLIVGFTPVSNRIGVLKLRVVGGVAAFVSTYAPHNLKPLPERISFYDDLGSSLEKIRVNGQKYIFGDLNARIGQRRHGEDALLGDFSFGREAQHRVEVPNRDLLLEFCESFGYAVANTWFPNPPHMQVTYHELGVGPMSCIDEKTFNVLDLLLVGQGDLGKVLNICSDRSGCVASHHFPITAQLDVAITVPRHNGTAPNRQWISLKDPHILGAFLKEVPPAPSCTLGTVDVEWSTWRDGILSAVDGCIPETKVKKKRPWITEDTLQLIRARLDARIAGDWMLEKQLRKETQKSVRKDRTLWLQELAGQGDWESLRKLRPKNTASQTRLKDTHGETVSSELRAETLADHLEHLQWRVRPISLQPDPPPIIHPNLPVAESLFTVVELRKAITKLKSGKSIRDGDIPIECFKALAYAPGERLSGFLDLCNTCWAHGHVPNDWLLSRVAMIFKKGDPSNCQNYRPICLTAVAYRVYASMIKQRLLDAGLDGRLWHSQFGFRTGRSTVDAIYVARRRIELACAQRGGQVSLLALDWAKALDSVHVGRLTQCLQRFGIRGQTLEAIKGLMQNRCFFVQDCGCKSSLRRQRSGISQGCTLSPLLFVVVMTAVMHDAVSFLPEDARAAYDRGELADVVYADDTLLLGANVKYVEFFLRAVAAAGRAHGLELHEDKFQLLQVRCNSVVKNNAQEPIAAKTTMTYLGAGLASDGRVGSKLSRRIGAARGAFRSLSKVWRHSSLTTARKLAAYSALVESKLMYGLVMGSFTKAELRRLDGFQAKCLRAILKIPSSQFSRVSNFAVRERATWKSASQLLLEQQLVFFGKVLRSPSEDILHQVSFVPGSLTPATSRYIRVVGHPRKEWVPELLPHAVRVAGGEQNLKAVVQDPMYWKRIVQNSA